MKWGERGREKGRREGEREREGWVGKRGMGQRERGVSEKERGSFLRLFSYYPFLPI